MTERACSTCAWWQHGDCQKHDKVSEKSRYGCRDWVSRLMDGKHGVAAVEYGDGVWGAFYPAPTRGYGTGLLPRQAVKNLDEVVAEWRKLDEEG